MPCQDFAIQAYISALKLKLKLMQFENAKYSSFMGYGEVCLSRTPTDTETWIAGKHLTSEAFPKNRMLEPLSGFSW